MDRRRSFDAAVDDGVDVDDDGDDVSENRCCDPFDCSDLIHWFDSDPNYHSNRDYLFANLSASGQEAEETCLDVVPKDSLVSSICADGTDRRHRQCSVCCCCSLVVKHWNCPVVVSVCCEPLEFLSARSTSPVSSGRWISRVDRTRFGRQSMESDLSACSIRTIEGRGSETSAEVRRVFEVTKRRERQKVK